MSSTKTSGSVKIHIGDSLDKLETQTLGGVSNLKFFCTIDIYEMAAIFNSSIMTDADIPFLLTLRKLETQTLEGGVSDLKFSYTIDIYKMVAIFVFVDTWKTRDPNFGGVSNLNIFCTIDIYQMVAIFQFFHNDRC